MFTRFADFLAQVTADLFKTLHVKTVQVRAYRPERHYMRGPGPQWHAKHDRAV
jgi:hypothetical protein